MKNSIAVIWWTPYDTNAWVIFLQNIWYDEILSFPIANTPDKQNELQFNNPWLLYEICLKICIDCSKSWINKMVIYCNSLSSVLDINKLSKDSNINIITPLPVYEILGKNYKNICILAANSSWAQIAEKYINIKWNKNIISIWFLDIVKKIESWFPVKKILKETHLSEIIIFLESQSVELILLSCTHFPYMTKELQKLTFIKVLDLDDWLQELL